MLAECFRKQYLGVNIFAGDVRLVDLKKGLIHRSSITSCLDGLSGEVVPASGWEDLRYIHRIISCCLVATQWSLRPKIIVLAAPSDWDTRQIAHFARILSEYRTTPIKLVHSMQVMAAGCGRGGKYTVKSGDYGRKIFVMCEKNITYIGHLWMGKILEVRKIEQGYEQIQPSDIFEVIDQIVTGLPETIPAEFSKTKIPFKKWKLMNEGWQRGIEKQIYLCSPKNFPDQTREGMGEYSMVDTYNDQVIEKGWIDVLTKIKKKQIKIG